MNLMHQVIANSDPKGLIAYIIVMTFLLGSVALATSSDQTKEKERRRRA